MTGHEPVEGEPTFDAPVLDPVVVSTLGAVGDGNTDRPLLMTVTLDPDSLPGLADAFALHRTGHRFDVGSQWSVWGAQTQFVLLELTRLRR